MFRKIGCFLYSDFAEVYRRLARRAVLWSLWGHRLAVTALPLLARGPNRTREDRAIRPRCFKAEFCTIAMFSILTDDSVQVLENGQIRVVFIDPTRTIIRVNQG